MFMLQHGNPLSAVQRWLIQMIFKLDLVGGWFWFPRGSQPMVDAKEMDIKTALLQLDEKICLLSIAHSEEKRNVTECVNQEKVQSIHSTDPRPEWNFSKAAELHTRDRVLKVMGKLKGERQSTLKEIQFFKDTHCPELPRALTERLPF
ncbi:Obscurin [Manis pentadactyla]|nr:Obscurin [Manis pentadactyla]